MRRQLLFGLTLLLSAAALLHAGDDETSRFLGPESDWGFARLELRDMHGLKGGSHIAIAGSGSACVRAVEPSRTEKRFLFSLSREEALAFMKLAVSLDLLGSKPRDRAGAPDEGRPELALENALGETRSVFRWQKDTLPAFEKIEQALRALEKKCAGKEPAYAGKTDDYFRPFEGVPVTIGLYSGRPDPSFELVRPEDWEKLRALTKDLAPVARPDGDKAAPLGYHGFLLAPRGIEGLPRWISVFKETIQAGDSPRAVLYEKDERGLEAWLKEEAKKRGFATEAPR